MPTIDEALLYKDASRATGIHNDSISRVCKGKSKTAGGYRWRYLNE